MLKDIRAAIERLPEPLYSTRTGLFNLLDSATWHRGREAKDAKIGMFRDLTNVLSSLYWTREKTPNAIAYVAALTVLIDQYAYRLDKAVLTTLADLATMPVED